MPSLGADMERGTLVEWKVAPGDEVHRGDIVAVIDTEKSTIEVEVFEDGVVRELLVAEGDEAAVGAPLAELDPIGGGKAESRARRHRGRAPTPEPAPEAEPPVRHGHEDRSTSPASATTAGTAEGHGPKVTSPLVRHRADELHVDLAELHGSGPGGLVTRDDVEAAAGTGPEGRTAPATGPAPAARAVPGAPIVPVVPPSPRPGHAAASPLARRLAAERGLDLSTVAPGPGGTIRARDLPEAAAGGGSTAMAPPTSPATDEPATAPGAARRDLRASRRASIGALMARSKREIPHYYVSTTIDLGPLTAWLAELNAERSPAERVLPVAALLTAVCRAAVQVPVLNGHFVDGELRPHDGVDLGVAVSLRGGGLVAPAIHDAHLLGVEDMMTSVRDLVARARSGSLRGSEMTDPSITVTNLGDQGVESVLPVIYPPQVAMVGLGTVVERPWAVDGMLAVRPVVTATLAGDHRANDGHDGARFLMVVDRVLQRPAELSREE